MKKMTKIAALSLPLIALMACAPSPEQFETPPVQVQSEKGLVTCQLYTKDTVVWDRAIDRPSTMSVIEGDNICKAEGERRKNA